MLNVYTTGRLHGLISSAQGLLFGAISVPVSEVFHVGLAVLFVDARPDFFRDMPGFL